MLYGPGTRIAITVTQLGAIGLATAGAGWAAVLVGLGTISLTFAALRQSAAASTPAQGQLNPALGHTTQLLEHLAEAVFVAADNGDLRYLNPAARQLTGLGGAVAPAKLVDLLGIRDEHGGMPRDPLAGTIQFDAPPALVALVYASGQQSVVTATLHRIASPGDGGEYRLLILRDRNEARTQARQIAYQATHDALTGLINRYEFERRLESALTQASRAAPFALLHIDLDQFKLINDTCGHAAGDAVLCRFAALVRREAPRGAILARIGADEIAVLLERASAEFSLALAERVVAALHAESFDWEEHTLELGAHAVVLPLAEAGLTSRDILIAIDAARLASRGCGSSRVRLCHPNGHETAIARGEMRWVPRLTKALAEDRLRLFAQPAMALGQAPGGGYVEILARLEGESGELVMPGEFIAAAERFQRIRAIDRRIVVQSLRLLDDAGVEHDGVFAINLSGHSIGDGEFLAAVLDALDTYPRIPPHKLCFEITETAAVANFAEAHQFMNALRQRGCRFALDDFGAGLSSFAYLKSLPVDYLKIDGRFVRDIAGSPTDHSIVDAVHRVGRAMGMRTIAESVESDAALDAVRAIGADYAQGFQCARPQPLQDVLAAMRAHSVGSLH